jgi:formylglycine-generating enzyme required for sulfatase activity
MKSFPLFAFIALLFSLGFQDAFTQETAVSPSAEDSWTNSLGMKFVPAGTEGVLFCVWDVRVADFQAYVEATGYQQTGGIFVMRAVPLTGGNLVQAWELDPKASWDHPGFEQAPAHPVVGVSWDEAQAFCHWLTEKERKEGTLGPNQSYRLPTDAEWSKAAGEGKFPWGNSWPPSAMAGNYFDEAFILSLPKPDWAHVPVNDGYPVTSPVGSFPANAYGLYDMGGNVWQWCESWYKAPMNSEELRKKLPGLNNDGGGKIYKVLRGASWADCDQDHLLTSYRNNAFPGGRNVNLGFRVVVVDSP